MEKYFEINKNGQNIRCKLYYEKGKDIKKAVLFSHGFAGHKDNKCAEKFAERLLSKYKGMAVIAFNLPCHGDDVKKKFMLSDCINYTDIVINYIKEELGAEEIYSYATSFGGYLILKYIAEHGNPFVKIGLRCPAVNMWESLTGKILNENKLELLNRGKTVPAGFDRTVDIGIQFVNDVKNSDIRKNNYLEYADNILIVHGGKDEVIPYEEVEKFAENNVIELVRVDNANHQFNIPEHMEAATKKILEFFAFR